MFIVLFAIQRFCNNNREVRVPELCRFEFNIEYMGVCPELYYCHCSELIIATVNIFLKFFAVELTDVEVHFSPYHRLEGSFFGCSFVSSPIDFRLSTGFGVNILSTALSSSVKRKVIFISCYYGKGKPSVLSG